jgi:hypothetical protein
MKKETKEGKSEERKGDRPVTQEAREGKTQ